MYKHKKMSGKLSKKRTSKSRKTNKHIKKVKSKRSKRSNSFSHGNSRSANNNKNNLSHGNSHGVNNYQMQNGGFTSCNLATVQEPEFNLPALGDIAGLNIAKSRGVIYRPDCKPDTYQAMIP
jgi:hypothetical protein